MNAGVRLLAAAACFAAGFGLLRVHDRSPGVDYLAVPASSTMRLLAAGFDNLVADGLFLEFVHYFGRHLMDHQKFYNVYPVAALITDLDPHFETAYVMGSLALGDNKQAEDAEALWDKAVKHNPGRWEIYYQAGMTGFLFGDTPEQYVRAARRFHQAAELPGAPPSARFLEARMYDVAHRGDTLREVWLQTYLQAPSPEARAVAARALRRLKVPLPRLPR